MSRSHFGSIQYLDRDRYRVFWTVDGKRMSKVVRGSRRTAEAYLAKVYGGGLPDDTTWAELWAGKVLPDLWKLSAHTRSDYVNLWEKYLEPQIANECVCDMDWSRANEVLTSIKAPSKQRYAGRLLRKMCYIAIRDKSHLLVANPVQAINYAKPVRAKKNLVDAADVGRLMNELVGSRYEPIILAELGGGLRPEEADALLWEDVRAYEFKGVTYCAVDVNKALTTVGGKKLLKETKNENSARTVIMGEPFASRLLELADGKSGPFCPSKTKRGEEPNESWYISPITITHNFREWCRAKCRKLPYTCQEHMRSSYATIAGEAGAPDSLVEGNMGHVGNTVKTRNYQRVTTRGKCLVADMIAEFLAELEGSGVPDNVRTCAN